jgi:hypothetical protein
MKLWIEVLMALIAAEFQFVPFREAMTVNSGFATKG